MIKVNESIAIGDIEKRKKDSLMELSKDPKIKAFMEENNVGFDVLSDYWAELIAFTDDHAECVGCTGLADCKKVSKGMQKELKYDGQNIITTLSYCQFGEEKKEENEVLRHFLFNNVSSKIALEKLKDTHAVKNFSAAPSDTKAAVQAILNYQKNPTTKGIYISGRSGTGKTALMAGLMNALARQGKDVGIMNMTTFLYEMKASFNSYEDESYLEQILKIPYLLIDGLCDENVTPWSRDEILSTILNFRSINELPTFFTSTFTIDDLASAYATRSKDRADKLRSERISDKIGTMCDEYSLS